ncbi:hypothetical protein OPT61_g6227 [Boeremia exigua]|uniref:Uncharacterized protein n=1 Tax=Boeremia exigua TaxID=749465 RepID=A0ACC2I7H7_9PLEO|nr:hypothetical protein OPT61_g6227 [Boeremia exigua]
MSTHETFSCDLCPKSFESLGRYNQHLKTHSKPWKCKNCLRGFGLRADLNRHVKLRHTVGNQKYSCRVEGCVFNATRKDNLTQHTRRSHSSTTNYAVVLQDGRKEQIPLPAEIAKQPPAGWILLIQSASNGNISILTTLLESGCDLNSTADDGSTAMHCAARAGHTKIVHLLIERGAAHSVTNLRGRSALFEAVVGGYPDCILLLLRAGATTPRFEQERNDAVSNLAFVDHIIRIGNFELIKNILREKTTQLKYETGSKVRALAVAAARVGDMRVLGYLLDCDPDVLESPYKHLQIYAKEWIECKRQGPLWYAILNGHTQAVQLLLTPSTNYKGPHATTLPRRLLPHAARKGFTEICELFMESMSQVYSDLKMSIQAALLVAAQCGHLSVIKAIKCHEKSQSASLGINLDREILAAFWMNHLDTAQYLLQWKEVIPRDEETHMETLSLEGFGISLIRKGYLKVKDRGKVHLQHRWQNKSLLYFAAEHNARHLVEFVLEHQDFDNATIDASFLWSGMTWKDLRETALGVAQRLGHTEVAGLLIAHGATKQHIKPAQANQEDPLQSKPPEPDSDLEMEEASDLDSDDDSF